MKPVPDLTTHPDLSPVVAAAVKLRKAYGLTQAEIAEQLGVCKATIQTAETARHSLRVSELEAWFGIFGWRLVAQRVEAPPAAEDARAAGDTGRRPQPAVASSTGREAAYDEWGRP